MLKPLFHAVGLCCSALVCFAAEPFRAGDRVAFVGDSITHGGSYHTLIQTFYATRFPHKKVLCFNVGISGDNAQGGFQRASSKGDGVWENDVSIYNPTAATVMLGMNDVGGWQFDSAETEAALIKQNDQQLEWYRYNYNQLLDNLEALSLNSITLIKSSAYDQTMVNPEAAKNLLKFGMGKNDLIVRFGIEVIDTEAKNRTFPVVDFNTPMLEINTSQQANDPSFSIVGNDRVHPAANGHMVMAYTFLKAQGLDSSVAKVSIDGASGKLWASDNCSISGITSSSDHLEFNYFPAALSFPLAPYQSVNGIVPFETDFNQETLRVTGLASGNYKLRIDATEVETFTAKALSQGINLALLKDSPRVVQANQVYAICKQRQQVSADIRAVVWSVGYLSKIKGHNANDFEANKAMIERIENGETPEGLWGPPSAYVKSLLQRYLKLAASYEQRIKDLEALSDPLYTAAIPQTHHVRITKVK